MEAITAKTVRFSELVKACGAPHVLTLWGDPKHDPEMQKAVRQSRVMTVRQTTIGSKADFGLVGFHPEKNATYLIFPKSLDDYQDRRVVGIKYDLIETPLVTDPAKLTLAPRRKANKRPAPEPTTGLELTETPSKPKQKPRPSPKFKVQVERIATQLMLFEISASNQSEARKEALQLAQDETASAEENVTYRAKSIVKIKST